MRRNGGSNLQFEEDEVEELLGDVGLTACFFEETGGEA